MNIRLANENDVNILANFDQHISEKVLETKIKNNEILIVTKGSKVIGWLRYGLFWDEHPFMNLLYIFADYRNEGYGSKLTQYWENLMRDNGHNYVLVSTQSDEYAQHFYRKLGYKDIGAFTFANDPLELIMLKEI